MNILDLPSVGFRPAAFLSGSPGSWASHLPFACDLVAALRPQVLVELGVSYGDSYFGFCQAVAEAGAASTCYGVDTFSEASVYETVNRHNDRLYRSFSHLLRIEFDAALDQFSSESIGLLHLNAFRGYEDARAGFDRWLPKVRPGGLILLHGPAVRSGERGVWRLWEELARQFPAFAFRGGNGLGVLRKPGASGNESGYLNELLTSPAETQERIRRYYALCAERIELEHAAGPAHAPEEVARQRKAEASNVKEKNALTQQLAIAKGNVEELTAEIERLAAEQAESRAELVEARKVTSRVTALLEQERMLRAMMENSHS